MIKSNITNKCIIDNTHYKAWDSIEEMLIPKVIGLITSTVTVSIKRLNRLLPQGHRYHGYTL